MFSGSTFASRIKMFHRFAVHLEALRAQVTNSKEVPRFKRPTIQCFLVKHTIVEPFREHLLSAPVADKHCSVFFIKFHLSSSAGRGKSSGFTPAFFILAPHSPQYLTATQLMKWHFLQRKCSQVHRPGFSSHSDSSGGTSGRKIFAVFLPGSATVTRVIFLIFALDMRISSVPSLSRLNNAALISVHPHTLRISHHRQALCCPALRSALWSAAADPNGSVVYRTPHSSSRPPACHAMPRRGE